jgi:hypothetical protein
VVGHRADMSRTHEMELSCEQTIRSRGVCAPALEPRGEWEGSRTRCQGFKPDLGNSAVRHYRGASETVAMAELRTHLATERVRVVALRLKQTRPSSIPTVTGGESNFSAESSPGISDYNRSCETLHHQNDERLFHVQVPTL